MKGGESAGEKKEIHLETKKLAYNKFYCYHDVKGAQKIIFAVFLFHCFPGVNVTKLFVAVDDVKEGVILFKWAVAEFTEQSFPIPEVHCSDPIIGNYLQ